MTPVRHRPKKLPIALGVDREMLPVPAPSLVRASLTHHLALILSVQRETEA
jgi:hypothetical protein